jgi:hypothetical protein
MADELEPKKENEDIGRTNEDVAGSAGEEEEFEEIDEAEGDEGDEEELVS